MPTPFALQPRNVRYNMGVNAGVLLRAFDEACAKTRSTAEDAWKKVDIARGMAVYDPGEDNAVDDVARRADKLMYENKWSVKGMKTER